MFRFSPVLTLTTAMLAAATLAGAQTSTSTKSTTMKPAAQAAPAKAATTTLVASGKLAKFDTTSSMLTVTTTKGDVMFTLAPTTKVTEGTKVVKLADLGGMTGLATRVQYTEKDGTKTVASVRLTAPAAKPAAAAPKKKTS